MLSSNYIKVCVTRCHRTFR